MCVAQGHKAAPSVGIEPRTSRLGVRCCYLGNEQGQLWPQCRHGLEARKKILFDFVIKENQKCFMLSEKV